MSSTFQNILECITVILVATAIGVLTWNNHVQAQEAQALQKQLKFLAERVARCENTLVWRGNNK